MTKNKTGFDSEDFKDDYFQLKRNALLRLIELQKLVGQNSDDTEFTKDEIPKLDRLKALNFLLNHAIEDFENIGKA